MLTFDKFKDSLKMIAASKYGTDEPENIAKLEKRLCSSSGPRIAGTTVYKLFSILALFVAR